MRRKGVSPVIAVVLMIALTVAAAAIVWGITAGMFDIDPLIQVEQTNTYTNGTHAQWLGTIKSNEGGIVNFRIYNGSVDVVGSVGDNTLVADSEKSFRVFFVGDYQGDFTLEIALVVDGDITTTTLSVFF